MPNQTPNYNLKKPLGTENYNVEDQNSNMDTIDTQMKANADAINTHKSAAVLDHPDNSVTDAKIGNRTVNQALAAPANTGPITSLLSWIAGRIMAITGETDWKTAARTTLKNAVKLTGDIMTGALTTTQLLLTNGTKLSETAGQRTTLSTESDRLDVVTKDGTKYILSAKNPTASFEFMRFDLLGANKVVRSGKDANGKFTQVDYYRADETTLFQRTVLSGTIDANGNYPTLTITRYADDGVTVVSTIPYAISYDADGDYTLIA